MCIPLQIPPPAPEQDASAAWRADVYARAISGESRAYAEILEAFRPRILRYATRMLGDQDAAEDIAQEAFVRAFQSFSQCTGPEAMESWLFSIVANRCRTALKKRTRRERLFARFHRHDDRPASVEPATPVLMTKTAQIARALDALSPEQREAFVMRHVDGMGYDEIARVTGAGVSALKMRVARARDVLRERLAEELA